MEGGCGGGGIQVREERCTKVEQMTKEGDHISEPLIEERVDWSGLVLIGLLYWQGRYVDRQASMRTASKCQLQLIHHSASF
jgi:hypothetical protein